MSAENTASGYGWLSIGLHWLTAAGVLLMFSIGLRADALGEAGDRAGRAEAMGWHIGVGSVLVLFLAWRIVSHYTQRQPDPLPQPALLNLVAALTHHGLLLALLILIVSGPLAVWSGGGPINVAGVLPLPSPFAERNDAVHEAAEQAHAIGRYMLYGLVPVHILGAMKHLLQARRFRMLKPQAN